MDAIKSFTHMARLSKSIKLKPKLNLTKKQNIVVFTN